MTRVHYGRDASPEAALVTSPGSAPEPLDRGRAAPIRATEPLLRSLIDNSTAVIYVKDPGGRYILINRRYEELFHVTADALVGKTDYDIFPTDRADAFRANDLAALEAGRPLESEEVVPQDDGLHTYISIKCPVYDDAGEPYGVCGISTDITDRKRVEALRAGEARLLEMIARGAPLNQVLESLVHLIEAQTSGLLGSVLLLDEDGRHLRHGAAPSLPDAYNRLVDGLELGPVAGSCGTAAYRQAQVIVTDTQADPLWEPYRGIAQQFGLRASWSTPIFSLHGQLLGTFAMYYREVRSPSADELRLIELATHLAGIAIERTRAERELRAADERFAITAELRASEERFAIAFQSIPISLAITTLEDGRLLAVNDYFAGLTGYTREELVGRTVIELGIWADPEARDRALLALAAEGKVENFEAEMRTKTSELRPQLLSIRRIRLEGRDCLLTAATDITERKRAEAALRQNEEELRQSQRMEALGRLAGGVAHDFNNLLTAIGGYTGFLLDALPPASTEHADAEQIRQAADRATSLTRQLLAFSRRRVFQPQSLDLNEIVTNMDKLLRRLIGADVELVTVLSPELPRIDGDRSQLEQVIVNLVLNARDAMPQGGKLVIETGTVVLEEPELDQPRSLRAGTYRTLSVRDTGMGMDAETRMRVFEPFFTTKEPGHGTGLGLSTVFGIVEQAGGRVTVDSEPGQGTTFDIVLPASRLPITPAEERIPRGDSLTGTETILLVEDEDVLRSLAARTLREQGYEVLEAHYGSEALMMWRKRRSDIALVVADVVMPGMSGIELAERLASEDPTVKIVVMSGFADAAAAERLRLSHPAGFLEKPFTAATLLRTVRETIDRVAYTQWQHQSA